MPLINQKPSAKSQELLPGLGAGKIPMSLPTRRAGRERGGNEKDTELSAEQLQHPKTGRVESSQSKWRDRGENAASREPERHGVPAA